MYTTETGPHTRRQTPVVIVRKGLLIRGHIPVEICETRGTHRPIAVIRWTEMELCLRNVMPIAPPPSTFRCPKCGWHKTVAPKSDVMVRGHSWFESCHECHHAPLERSPASVLELAMAKIRDVIGK